MAEPLPVGDVVVVHRRPPAEDVVADEEAGDDGDRDRDERDAREGGDLAEEFGLGDRPRRPQCLLHHVVEGAEPVVDHHIDLDLEPGGEDDHGGRHDRPPEPAVRREIPPEEDEDRPADEHVFVEPEVGGEALRALEQRRSRLRPSPPEAAPDSPAPKMSAETQRGTEIADDEIPEQDGRQRPHHGGQEEQLRSREEGRKHGHPRSGCRAPAPGGSGSGRETLTMREAAAYGNGETITLPGRARSAKA